MAKSTRKELKDEIKRLERDNLSYRDAIDDLLYGLRYWSHAKANGMELTIEDEMLIRWVDASSNLQAVAEVGDLPL